MNNRIKDIEKKIKIEFPENYTQFLESNKKYNNKEFCIILQDGYKIESQIETFSTIETFEKDNKYREFLTEFQEYWELSNNYVQSNFLYIIASGKNNSICMAFSGKHKGKIYYADNGDFGIIYLAKSLTDFLKNLYSISEYRCSFSEIKKAVIEKKIDILKDLIENKDGFLIISRSSFYKIELVELAKRLKAEKITEYLYSIK